MKKLYLVSVMILLAFTVSAMAQTNLLPNGDLETLEPNFWTPIGEGPNITASWAGEGYNGSEHSFKIEKTVTATKIAGWESDNNADLYWNNAAADVLYSLGFYVKTEGVNTSPATDDEKIGVMFEFFNGGVSLGESTIWIDQTAADMDWTEFTDGLLITAGLEPDEITITAFMGMEATGTVYFDNISCGTDPWSMGVFNGDAEIPEGWLNWASTGDVGYANLDSTFSHSGDWSALLLEEDDLGDEMVFYSEPIDAEPSTWYQLSVWVKYTCDSTSAEWIPTNITDYKHDYRMNLCFFSHAGNLMTEWSPTGGDRFFYFDERAAVNDWTLYTVLYMTEEDATGLSVRARFNNFTKGFCYFDDFMVEKVELGPNLLPNGDLETYEPNFWSTVGEGQGGVTHTWAWEGYSGSEHSFKINKTATTGDIAGWESDNNADLYWNNAAADVAYSLGFYVKTEGVNTSPATDDEKIGVMYEFYSGGVSIGEATVYIDQTTADMDWTEFTDGLLITPGLEPDEIYVTAFMGKDATGTVYFDNISCGTDPWSMGVFNSDAETPAGWLNWASADDVGYANITDAEVHGGSYSAMLLEQDDLGDEMVFYSEPIVVDPSTWYLVSVWAMHTNDSTNMEWLPSNVTDYKHDYRMNLCFFSHAGNLMTEWSPTGGDRFFYFEERETDVDWTHYTIKYKTEEDATGFSVRARFNNFTKGTCYYDDFAVQKITHLLSDVEDWDTNVGEGPQSFGLEQNYPNPFNPTTQIGYILSKNGFVELDVYNIMGQRVRSLVNDYRQAGTYKIIWDGRDESGTLVQSGVYFYQLKTADNIVTKRMVFVK